MKEHIRTWHADGFRLELFDTFHTDRYGKSRLAYEFYHDGTLIFEGDDFCCSPLHGIDSDETVGALLTFLSLRPGDTDPEYFESYTPEQLAWSEQYGEEVSMYALELEEQANVRPDHEV